SAHPEVREAAQLPEVQAELARWHHDFRPDVEITGWGDAAAARRLVLGSQAAWGVRRGARGQGDAGLGYLTIRVVSLWLTTRIRVSLGPLRLRAPDRIPHT